MTRQTAQRRRLGFTLIELLVVLVILGILIALLVPAIAGAVRTARGAAVQAEINQFAQALADFRSKYGDYPPSRFMINENGFYDTTNSTVVTSGASSDVTYGQIAQRSVSALRKFFPQAVISTSGNVWPNNSTTFFLDFNGNGVIDPDPLAAGVGYVMEGHECLVFFLGGVPQLDGNGKLQGVSGFGKNPKFPFSNNNPSSKGMYSGNRTAPLYEFAADRLVVNPTNSATPSYSGMPGYLDSLKSTSTVPLQNVYAYFSTNMGAGYDPNDVNFNGAPFAKTVVLGPIAETDSAGNSLGLTFTTNQPTIDAKTKKPSAITLSPTPNPYTSSAPSGSTTVSYFNNQSFQIISAGVDGVFGVGGIYAPGSTGDALPREDSSTSPNAAPYPYSPSTDSTIRTLEADNLTNFHPGKLQ